MKQNDDEVLNAANEVTQSLEDFGRQLIGVDKPESSDEESED